MVTVLGAIADGVCPAFLNAWSGAYRWRNLQSSWMHDSWDKLDGDVVDKDVQGIFKVLTKTSKVLANRQLPACAENCTAIKDEVGAFKPCVPLVRALRNPGMCDRHWARLSEELGQDIHPDDAFTLAKALEMGLLEEDSMKAVLKVSDIAGKEHSIEQALDKMQNDLGEVELGVLPYRETGTYIIKVRLTPHALVPLIISFHVAVYNAASAALCSSLEGGSSTRTYRLGVGSACGNGLRRFSSASNLPDHTCHGISLRYHRRYCTLPCRAVLC